MYRVEVYLRFRRAVMVEGMSIREAAREFGLHRDTVRKMLAYSVPPGYRRRDPPKRPKLEPYTGVIDQILGKDHSVPKKQRHTAKRIYERLRDEYGFGGGYTTVKDYVREHRRQTREMFVPLSHALGHGQCDFGEALVVIGGGEQKAHYFILDLPHSDGCFVKAYPAETTEAFLDGPVSAFAFMGGVPQSILYDNTKLAVARILNQSQGGMCICRTLGIGPGGAPECLGPGLQDRTAAALHLVLPAGQSGEEIADPLLNGRLASQAQVARRLLSRPSPDRLVGVEVRAVTRQIHQPQPRCPQILPHRLATMGRRVVPNHIQRPGVSLAQLGQEGRRCPGVAVTLQFHPFHPRRSPGKPPSSSWPSPHSAGCWSQPRPALP